MTYFSFYALISIISYVLTWALRQYALATNLLDIPNYRSSHEVPTPRGGGLSFVICFLSALCLLMYMDSLSPSLFAALMLAGCSIAILGFLDDHGHVPAGLRLLGHFIASGMALWCIGGMPTFSLFSWAISPGLLANILALFYLVWLLNLYNFMDGIDGLAAMEAITVCLSGALLYYLGGYTDAIILPLVLAMAVSGFLYWNFPVARIFMGDAGSGFLGIILGLLSIQAASFNPSLFWSWLILLGVFIVDATTTLFYRILQRQQFFAAHRTHAYQHAVRYYGKHWRVTLSVLAINVLWLLPLAILVSYQLINSGLGLVIAYLPLIIITLIFRAGRLD